MNAYLEIIRPGNAVMGVIAVVLMAIIGENYNLPIILGGIAVFLAMGGGNVINDYFDHKIDAINKPNRPIPSGRISLKNAKLYAYLLFLLSIIIGFIISYLVNSLIPGIIVIISLLLMYYYAYTLKKNCHNRKYEHIYFNWPLFYLWRIYNRFRDNDNKYNYNFIVFRIFFAFIMTMAREITKDMEDIEGDKAENARTFPILYGMKKSSYLAGFLMILASILSPILYFNGIFSIYYILVLFFLP